MDATISNGFYKDPKTQRTFFVIKGLIPPWVKSKPAEWELIKREFPLGVTFIGKTVKPEEMRYETLGDWKMKKRKNSLELEVSTADMENNDYNFLIQFHELIEVYLCQKRNITDAEVMEFDKKSVASDPGNSEKAPYHDEHMFACKIEKMVSEELKVNWEDYNKRAEEVTGKVINVFKKKGGE